MRQLVPCGLLALSACGGGGGDGPRLPTASRPGPCSSVSDDASPRTCTMAYDEADRLVEIDCVYDVYEHDGMELSSTELRTFRYDGDVLVERARANRGGLTFTDERIDFAAVPITGYFEHASFDATQAHTATTTYEADPRFSGHPLDTERPLLLGIDDALVTSHEERTIEDGPPMVTEHTFTYDGAPHVGTRTRTRDDGVEQTFEYDAQGRLIAASGDATMSARIYAYDGDRLIRDRFVVYEYDELGNLLRRIGGTVTVYDYSCWE